MGRRACRARGGSPAWLLATLSLLLLPLAATADVLDALGSLRESMAQHYDGVLGAAAHMWSAGAAPQGRPPTWMAKPAPVLAYVTPQNGVGYDMAKNHRCRLHYVSPDWFHLQITRGMPELRGSQEVDAEWVAAVREPCSAGAGASGRSSSQVGAETNGTDGGSQEHIAHVLPRVTFDVTGQDLLAVFQRPGAVASMLGREAQRRGFDGWVVEAWSLWATMGVTQHPQAREAALGLLKRLAAVLAQAGKRLVLAVAPLRPPLGQPAQLTEADAEELLAFVDALSVQTYDHAGIGSSGPSSPLPWVIENAGAFAAVADRIPGGSARSRVLLGLAFFGREYSYQGQQLVSSTAVTSTRLMEVLRMKAAPDEEAANAEADEEETEPLPAELLRPQQCSGAEALRQLAAPITAVCSASAASEGSASSSMGSSGSTISVDGLHIDWLEDSQEHLFRWAQPATEAAAPESSSSDSGSSGEQPEQQQGEPPADGLPSAAEEGSSGGLQQGAEEAGGQAKVERHQMYFPTPRSIAERLAVAAEHGLGVAVWELGQGLDEYAALL